MRISSTESPSRYGNLTGRVLGWQRELRRQTGTMPSRASVRGLTRAALVAIVNVTGM